MRKYIVLIVILFFASRVVGQNDLPDSLDYIALKTFTHSNAWVSKYKSDPISWLDEETFNYIKEKYPLVNKEYSELKRHKRKKEKWDEE